MWDAYGGELFFGLLVLGLYFGFGPQSVFGFYQRTPKQLPFSSVVIISVWAQIAQFFSTTKGSWACLAVFHQE